MAFDDSDEARFGKRVKILPNGCWAFNGNLESYGNFARKVSSPGASDREPVPAHRFAYETLVGRIPDGHHLHHECQNKGCVNPAHLEAVTQGENLRRSPHTQVSKQAAALARRMERAS
jgi:hypothetical protein